MRGRAECVPSRFSLFFQVAGFVDEVGQDEVHGPRGRGCLLAAAREAEHLRVECVFAADEAVDHGHESGKADVPEAHLRGLLSVGRLAEALRAWGVMRTSRSGAIPAVPAACSTGVRVSLARQPMMTMATMISTSEKPRDRASGLESIADLQNGEYGGESSKAHQDGEGDGARTCNYQIDNRREAVCTKPGIAVIYA